MTIWFYLWWPILYIYILFYSYGTFDGLFRTHTSSCFPIFYVPPLHYVISAVVAFMAYFVYLYLSLGLSLHILRLTYSVPLPSLDDVFCTQGTFWRIILYNYFPMFDLFSTSTTSWWPSLFTCEFMAYFVYLLLLREISNDYMGAYLCWTILYTYHLLMTYIGLFCTHTSPCLTYSLQMPPLHHLVCTLGNFMAHLIFSSWWA